MLKEIGKQKAKLTMEIKQLDEEAAEYDEKQKKVESAKGNTMYSYGTAGGTMASYSGIANGSQAARKRSKANSKRKELQN